MYNKYGFIYAKNKYKNQQNPNAMNTSKTNTKTFEELIREQRVQIKGLYDLEVTFIPPNKVMFEPSETNLTLRTFNINLLFAISLIEHFADVKCISHSSQYIQYLEKDPKSKETTIKSDKSVASAIFAKQPSNDDN